jgi:hypothetical protein
MTKLSLGFLTEPLSLPLDMILPSHKIPNALMGAQKFIQICSSIKEIGLIEPLSVVATSQRNGQYLLLDGHLRLLALKQLEFSEALCLVATDDETYTYNNRINRLSSVQEHIMIKRAIERGVSEERLAKALSVDVRQIHRKSKLLDGICPEAADLLVDRRFSPEVPRILRKMKPTRQVECVELMISANNLTVIYADAMLVATPKAMLLEGKEPRNVGGVSQEQMAKMEREMGNLQEQYKMVEQTYGQDILNLVLARGYLSKLVDNKSVSRYLQQRHPEILGEFGVIIQAVSVEQ